MTTMGLEYLKYSESMRANKANEALKARQQTEVERSNRANEALSSERNAIGWKEASIKQKSLDEQMEHNDAVEFIQRTGVFLQNMPDTLAAASASEQYQLFDQGWLSQGEVRKYNFLGSATSIGENLLKQFKVGIR